MINKIKPPSRLSFIVPKNSQEEEKTHTKTSKDFLFFEKKGGSSSVASIGSNVDLIWFLGAITIRSSESWPQLSPKPKPA